MFEKLSEIAERSATSASRRQFLGRIGRGALVAAGAISGFLAFGAEAQAGGLKVCGTGSAWQCAGRPVGSLCGTPSRPGRCKGAPDCTCQPIRRR
jgi:hypothetical protein